VSAFDEAFGLIKTNLNLTDAQVSRAALEGLVKQLQPQVQLATNQQETASLKSPILDARVFDHQFGYTRIGEISRSLAREWRAAFDKLSASNRLKGLVIDLRFSTGYDHNAAAALADYFFAEEKPLLQSGETTLRSAAKQNALTQPLAILVNGETRGAAEALAAMLRQADLGLIIGSPTAGQAFLYKEFPLSDGSSLKIASGPLTTISGAELSGRGLNPDILIAVTREDEKAWLEDPYRELPRLFAESTRNPANPSATNQVGRRRLNEAELVRMQREGLDPGQVLDRAARELPPVRVVNDPALARALDFLKGLALVQSRR
jgi:hypothetical protein